RGAWNGLGLVNGAGILITGPLSAGKRKDLSNRIRDVIAHKYPRYHWLAPLPTGNVPRIIDFQVMQSLQVSELETESIVAELSSPYREEVAARYSAYMGRVGTPDHSGDQMSAWIDQGIDLLFPTPAAVGAD